jgi:hypothetical protein
MPLTTARGEVHERSLARAMTITVNGLVLGGTVLAAMRDIDGAPEIGVDGAQYWRKGEKSLAAIELALSGLPPLPEEEQASSRLFLGERLLAEGLSPRELLEACGLDPAMLDLVKTFNPDQPRVPAGNPSGGQWTGDNAAGGSAGDRSSVRPTGQPTVLTEYKVIKEPPKDARVVIP